MTFNAVPPPWKFLTHWIPLTKSPLSTDEHHNGVKSWGWGRGAYIPVKGLAKLCMWICTVSAAELLTKTSCPIFTSTNAHLNYFVRYNSLGYSLNYLVLHSLMCSLNTHKWAADWNLAMYIW